MWANMGRNLSRQPEGALAFLERARAAPRSATAALQAGLVTATPCILAICGFS